VPDGSLTALAGLAALDEVTARAGREAGPNLLRLKAFFSRQWRQLPTTAAFMAVFGPYSHRIGDVLDRFDPAVLRAAARHVGDHDDEVPLRPEESTQ